MQPLRFGLIGTGHWAVHTHGAALASSPAADLHGVWGRDPAKAQDVAAKLGCAPFADLDELLAHVDAVAFAVPPDVQAPLAVRAAEAGCHLLLEKPLALDIESAQAVVSAVDAAGVAALVFFTARFRPDVEDWTMAAAELGPWHSAHLVHYANIFQPGSPYASSAWRREYGALWDVGPHALAAVLPIMGGALAVAARRGPVGSDTVHIVLSHAAAGTPSPVEIMPEPTLSAGIEAELGPALDSEGASASEGPSAEVALAEAPPRPPAALTAVPAGPVASSTLSLSLTMPPAAVDTRLALYGETGVRVRPEANFEVTEVFANALGALAKMVASGERRHPCDTSFGLEVVRVLVAAEQAMDLPGIELV